MYPIFRGGQQMENNFKKYLLECLISFVVLCVLIFTCAFYVENKLLFFLIFIILFLFEKMCIRIFAQKNIYSIIYKDLNPELFLSAEGNKYLYLHPIYKCLGKISLGEYQEAVNICTFEIKQNNNSKDAYLANLSRIYFELDDINSLSKMCREFDVSLENNKNLIKKYPIFHFYRFYIDGKYNECIDFCEQRLEKFKDKSGMYNLLKLNNYFNLAISYYKNNNIDAAKKWFQIIISFAPKMYVAEISKKYLDSIENGETSFEDFPKIVPDESYQVIEKNSLKKLNLLKKVAWAVLIVSVILSIVLSIALPEDSAKNSTKYAEQLYDVIDVSYDDFKLLG